MVGSVEGLPEILQKRNYVPKWADQLDIVHDVIDAGISLM